MSLQNNLYDDGGGGKSGQLNLTAENAWDNDFIMPKRDPLYIVVPMTIMYSVIFVTGVIGNSITCMVIAKHKYMHTATNYYLFSLAVSDLILLVSGLPQEMWSIWSRYPYVFGEIFCQLRGLFSEMSANATVLTITAFTAERYVAICHPFMAQSMSKLSRAVKLIIIIWLVAMLFAIPQALQFTVSSWNGSSELMQCNIRIIPLMDTDIQLSTVSFTLSTLLFFLLPMTVITVLYALIGLRLRRSDKLKRTITVRSTHGEKKMSSPEYRANSSPKVLKMLVAVVVAFFICWAPFHAQRLIAIFGSSHASSGNLDVEDIPFLHQLYGISTYISGVLYYVSTTINPILYHIMSLKFRGAFKETVLRCCGGDSGCSSDDGWTGSGQRRPSRWARRRLRSDSSEPATDDRRPKYRRVSGRATSSVELPADDDDEVVCSGDGHHVPGAGLADCWRRALTGSAEGGNAKRHKGSSCYSAGSGGGGSGGRGPDDDDESSTTSAPLGGPRGPRLVKVPPAIALSNWTVISNSSLKDVDGDDLRDELVGYAADASVAIAGGRNGVADNFIRAKQKLKIALQLSEAEDLNSEIDEVLAKKKRRELANKRVNRQSTLSPKMIKSQTSKLSNFSIPPLPKDPFKSLPLVITQKRKICNLQSNKFKHSPKEKNCKKLDEVSMASHKNAGKNTRDNESCRKNIGHLYSPSTSQQDWSVDRTFIEVNDLLMASPPMFSPIKSGLKRSILDMTQQKPVKNVAVRKLFPSTQYNSDTSKIDSEAIDNYLMVTPSKLNNSPIISLRGHFQSTPESAHQNVTPVAVSQLMSSTTQSETFSKDSEANVNHGCILKFITSKLPQLNTKLNKIILNQSKHEELLKKILQNKTVHDESFYDNTDLEEFPLHNLDSLKEIDGKLKSDTLFYKCLVKRLKEFGGNNVYMVTKCIMDFLMTDNLGMQISLTGRGTNNKKNEKMSLISLTMFKLITRVILKNVSGSTITSINKAVTGWLKHAKERNGRRESS